VVVADDLLVRAGLCAILVASPGLTVCGEAGDLTGCRAMVGRVEPDVVLVDSRTPALDDLTVTRDLAADGSGPRVVVLTAPPPDDTVVAALRAGASGVLLKDAGPRQIVQALTIVSRGDAFIDPVLVRVVIEHLVTDEAAPHLEPGLGAATDRLTPAERDVLARVADGQSNREIGRALHLSEGAVKAHINRMFPKLGVENRVQAAVLAYRAGLHPPGR